MNKLMGYLRQYVDWVELSVSVCVCALDCSCTLYYKTDRSFCTVCFAVVNDGGGSMQTHQ